MQQWPAVFDAPGSDQEIDVLADGDTPAAQGAKITGPRYVSLLKSGKVKGVRFDTPARICAVLECQPGDVLEYRVEAEDPAGKADN